MIAHARNPRIKSRRREKLDEWKILETGEGHTVKGLKGKSPGKLRSPSSISVTAGGEMVLVDFNNRRIQVFAPRAAATSASLRSSDVVSTFKAGALSDGPFVAPTSAVPDGKGALLVADSHSHSTLRSSNCPTRCVAAAWPLRGRCVAAAWPLLGHCRC